MTQLQDLNVRRFLMETKEKAEVVLRESHTGADAKTVINDLLQVASNLVDLNDASAGQSADARVVKKRMEQQRAEMKAVEAKFLAAKNAAIQLATQIEMIALETKNIRSRTVMANDPNAASAAKIDAAVQALAKVITEISSL